MKKTATLGALALAGLWVVYAIGYQKGLRTERRAWERSSAVNTEVRMSPDDPQRKCLFHYRNPHAVPHYQSASIWTWNVPDLRNTAVK